MGQATDARARPARHADNGSNRRGQRRARSRQQGVAPDPQVVVPAATWAQIRRALIAARLHRHAEVLALLFCTLHRGSGGDRYLLRDWYVPGPGEYDHQSVGGLTLSQQVHGALLERYVTPGIHLVHVHTHPGACRPAFSSVDDRHEAAYAATLRYLPGRPRLVSGVFNEDLTAGVFRRWSPDGRATELATLRTGWVPTPVPYNGNPALFDRQRVFGATVQGQLNAMTIALVGCGGIGAPFAEQLARLGVRSWILVDDDRVALSNLHRMPFATAKLVERGTDKTAWVGTLIRRFWGREGRIRALTRPIEHTRVQRAVASADLIVVATDNHASRLVAQQVALRHLRPLLCLGTAIEQRPGEEAPRIYARATMPPVGGGWCLPCAGVIDLYRAAQEAADPATRAQLAARGYLDDVAAPAVYWVNSAAAALGVGLIHGAAAGFTETEDGVDWLIDLAQHRWLQIEHEPADTCYLCAQGGLRAVGEFGRITVSML